MRHFPIASIIIYLTLHCISVGFGQQMDGAYIFSYFKGNGEDGLHLAYSNDGLKWEALNDDKPYLAPKVGEDKLMRDPCLIKGPDDKFHMVWTVSWNERGIGYANSEDLVNWSEQQYIPVMEHEPKAMNCWAPEIFWDGQQQQYLIFWATTIPGKFPETASEKEENRNHRMYYTSTKDFQNFAETKLFYNDGFNVIDATVIKAGKEYVMFLKDETPEPPQKNIKIARAKKAKGPYSSASAPITGDYWAEGPTVVKVGDRWIVYFDKYRKHQMGAVASKNLKDWKDISDQVSFPDGTRHGTVLKVDKKVLECLIGKN